MSAAASPLKSPPEEPALFQRKAEYTEEGGNGAGGGLFIGQPSEQQGVYERDKDDGAVLQQGYGGGRGQCAGPSAPRSCRGRRPYRWRLPASRVLRQCAGAAENRTARTAKARRQRTARRLKVSIASSASLLKMKDVALAEMTAARSSSYLFIRRPARRITAPPRRRCFLCSRGRRRSLRRNISPGPRQAPRARRGHGPGLGS